MPFILSFVLYHIIPLFLQKGKSFFDELTKSAAREYNRCHEKEVPPVENPLDQKLDLSALHLGNISLGTLLGALLTLVICLVAVRLLTALLRRVLAQTHMDARVQKYLVRTVQLVLWVVTVLITADQLGIPVTSLVALLSVLSLAVSLAVQNVLANVAGGLVLLVTKPFAVGDYVDTPCGAGTVKELTLTYTYLDTPDGLRIAAPNSSLSAGKITNYTTLGTRRIQHWTPWPGPRACWRAPARRYTSMPTAKAASSTSSAAGPRPPTTGRPITPCWRTSRRPLTKSPWRCPITT